MYYSHISFKFSLHIFILNLFSTILTLKTISHVMMFFISQNLYSFFNITHSSNKKTILNTYILHFYLNTCTLRIHFCLFKTQIILSVRIQQSYMFIFILFLAFFILQLSPKTKCYLMQMSSLLPILYFSIKLIQQKTIMHTYILRTNSIILSNMIPRNLKNMCFSLVWSELPNTMDPKINQLKIKNLRELGYSEEEAKKLRATNKRHRNDEDSNPSGNKNLKSGTFAKAAKTFELIIAHKNAPTETLSDESLSSIIKELFKALDSESAPSVQFSRLNIDLNKIRISCNNLESKRWITEKIDIIDISKVLKITDINELPRMRFISLKVADPIVLSSVILSRIKKQNPVLNLTFWTVVSDYIHEDGDRVIVIQIDKDSLDKIKDNRMKIFCGFSELYVKRLHNYVKEDISELHDLSLEADDKVADNNDSDSDADSTLKNNK